jgi:hypothetical protein
LQRFGVQHAPKPACVPHGQKNRDPSHVNRAVSRGLSLHNHSAGCCESRPTSVSSRRLSLIFLRNFGLRGVDTTRRKRRSNSFCAALRSSNACALYPRIAGGKLSGQSRPIRHDERPISCPPTTHSDAPRNHPAMREIVMRHHRDRDMLWVTSGLPFLTWATAQTAPCRTGQQAISEGLCVGRGDTPRRPMSGPRARQAR